WLCAGFSFHCGAYCVWKLAADALLWQYCPADYRPHSCVHVRPGPGNSHLGRNFGAEFCVYICWWCSSSPSGDPAAPPGGPDFGRMFSGPDRSNDDGAEKLGTKLNVTSVAQALS